MDREVLTPKQLQETLQIGRKQTYELLHSGKIRSIRIGRSIRIPREALEEFKGNKPDTNTTWKTTEEQLHLTLNSHSRI